MEKKIWEKILGKKGEEKIGWNIEWKIKGKIEKKIAQEIQDVHNSYHSIISSCNYKFWLKDDGEN